MAVDKATGEIDPNSPEDGDWTRPDDAEKITSKVLEVFRGAKVATVADNDPQVVQAEMVARMFGAKTLDAMFDQFEAPTIDQLEGKVIEVVGVAWGLFNSEDGPIPLARLDVKADGAKSASLCIATAPNITSFVANAERLGAIPFKARVVGNKTARGFTALHFGRP